MGAFGPLVAALRTVQFYVITFSIYLITSVLIMLYIFFMLPLFLWDRKAIYKFTNWMLFWSFHFSSLVCNYAWKCVLVNDLPEDCNKKARVFMFNHLSAADPFLVSTLGKRTPIVCTYKDSLNRLPTAFPMLMLTGHIAINFTYDKVNDRKIPTRESVQKLMRRCKEAIDNGFNIAVYPEGKRSRDGVLQEFKDGFFRFAVDHGVEILPCSISNSNSLWWLDSKVLIGEGVAYICVGKPIDPTGKTVEELKRVTRKAIYEGLKRCPTFNPRLERVAELEYAKLS